MCLRVLKWICWGLKNNPFTRIVFEGNLLMLIERLHILYSSYINKICIDLRTRNFKKWYNIYIRTQNCYIENHSVFFSFRRKCSQSNHCPCHALAPNNTSCAEYEFFYKFIGYSHGPHWQLWKKLWRQHFLENSNIGNFIFWKAMEAAFFGKTMKTGFFVLWNIVRATLAILKNKSATFFGIWPHCHKIEKCYFWVLAVIKSNIKNFYNLSLKSAAVTLEVI